MDRVKVSILVPAYNVEDYLDECLQSLISQTLKEIEIVVVDDGSTDSTLSIARQYIADDSRIRVIELPEHQGVSVARKECLNQARGEYIAFVDSDDYISAHAIEGLYERAKSTCADVVLGSMLYCYPDGRQIRVGDKSSVFRSADDVFSGQESFKRMIEDGCYVPMLCGNMYRTAFIKGNELHFGTCLHEDEYFTPFALFHAKRVAGFNLDFYYYRQREGSIMHNPDNLRLRAESLSIAGRAMIDFALKTFDGMDPDVRSAYRRQGKQLCCRSQRIYEDILQTSPRKCLLVFSKESTAVRYGIGTYIRQLVQCFDPTEWDVHVITLHTSSCNEVTFRMEGQVAWYDFPIPQEQLSSNALIHEERYFNAVFHYWASRIGDGRKVFCHFNFSGHHRLALLFKERLGTPNVFTLHYTSWSFELLGDRELLKHYLEQPNNGVKATFERERAFMEQCCDCVIAIARHSYDMLHELYGLPIEKLAYIPNGLKDEFRERTAEERLALRKKYHYTADEKIILFAGRLDRVKGVTELIEAFKTIQTILPEARLIVAGSGNYEGCMEEASPCWRHIAFTGFVPKEQLYELHAIADIGVVPSIHEEFGYVALEMMLNKLPIVIHDSTGLSEISDKGRYAVTFRFDKNRNCSSLQDAILAALTENGSKVQIQEARNWVLEQYTIPLFRERIKRVYTCMENPCSMSNNN